jgi:hypothetical protein
MRRKIVDHDDVFAFERRGETPFDIGQELLSRHGAVNRLQRSHAMPAQDGDKGDRLPVALRDVVHQALAAATTAVPSHHFGIRGSLIDEHQPGRVEHALFSHPASPRSYHVCTLLLRCVQDFFEADLVTPEKAPYGRSAASNPALAHHRNYLISGSG